MHLYAPRIVSDLGVKVKTPCPGPVVAAAPERGTGWARRRRACALARPQAPGPSERWPTHASRAWVDPLPALRVRFGKL